VISGTNFTGTDTVAFGGAQATLVSSSPPTQLTVLAPPQPAGTVDVRVANAGGVSDIVQADQFLYVSPPPSVTSATPNTGPTAGGTHVTIQGTGFTGASGVSFGDAAASFTVVSTTQITAIAPAQAVGSVDIVVTTPSGASGLVPGDQFLYAAAVPTVTGLSRTSGPIAGNTLVAILGTNFSNAIGVTFGGSAANFTVDSATAISAFSAAHAAGQVDVQVSNPDGTSTANASDHYTYTAASPAVPLDAVEPAEQVAEPAGVGKSPERKKTRS
jgi:hypothetical protein